MGLINVIRKKDSFLMILFDEISIIASSINSVLTTGKSFVTGA